ncbi:hypothetical protein [Corallococcus sp. CA049B]|uniref:hypothetical protein n=1 Tax=Corallococcus sp. CA049B TaxID=2316730 RepID=UPI0011C3ECFE|nr:hypothetical protein [Corallococcus sp. CA049B]
MRTGVLVCCAVLLFTGCAPAVSSRTLRYSPRESARARAPGTHADRASASSGVRTDAWEQLLTNAGLDARDEQPLWGSTLTPTQAVRLLEVLLRKPVTLDSLPPRMVAGLLLREVLERGETSREELLRRVERFSREQVAVLRPDGCLAWALSGRTQQRVAPVEWRDGAFRAHGFELGRFYSGKGGVFRAMDARLQVSDGRPLAEVYDDADVIGRTLDGAEDAFVELYHALGQVLTRPADSIAGLRHLPAGVAALITSSPAYWERFQSMTRGEQIREVSRLTTGMLVTWGAASATTRTLKGMALGAEATVPVLSLSAEGALALERVAVPAGRAAAVLSGGPGAAIILHRSNTTGTGAAPSSGPKGYSSFKSFKRAMGPAGDGKEWHHIVEQTEGNASRFGPQTLHNSENIVALGKDVHSGVSSLYSSKRPRLTNSETLTVRQWLSTQSFEAQREFGLLAIQNVTRGIW